MINCKKNEKYRRQKQRKLGKYKNKSYPPPPPLRLVNKIGLTVFSVFLLILATLLLNNCGSSETETTPTPQTVTVTFDTQGGTQIQPQTITKGNKATKPTDPTKKHYTFKGWYTTATENTLFDFNTAPTEAETIIYAQWTIKQFTITYHSNKPPTAPADATVTGLAPDPKIININSGETTTAPTEIPTLIGYTFAGWYEGITSREGILVLRNSAFDFTTATITESKNLYAKWTIATYTITFHPNKPDGVTAEPTRMPTAPQNVNHGEMATAPTETPTLTDYNFIGWYAGTTAIDGTITLSDTIFAFTSTITENKNLYAKWLKTHTITYHPNKPDGVTAEPIRMPTAPQNVNHGEMATAPTETPTLTDYNFIGWYAGTTAIDGTITLSDTIFAFTSAITENKNLYAKWSQDPIVIFDTQGGTIINPQTLSGTPKTATRPTTDPRRKNYNFKGWFTTTNGDTLFNFNQEIAELKTTVYAQWTKIQYTITYYGNKPSGVSQSSTVENMPSSPQYVNSGGMTTAPTQIPTLDSYTFVAWYEGTEATDGTITLEITAFDFSTTTITDNKKLYATWTKIQLTITYYSNKPPTAPADATVTGLSPDPKTVNINSGEMATPPPETPALIGYTFAGWYEGTTATGGILSLADTVFAFTTTVITENKNLYAKWLKIHTITYHSNKPDGVTAEPTGMPTAPQNINSGEMARPPTETPALTGYNFIGWYAGTAATDGTLSLADTVFAFTTTAITENKNLYAKWSQDPVVVFDTQGGSTINPQTLSATPKRATQPTTPPTKEHYNFKGWFTTADGDTLFNFNQDISIPKTTVFAQWTRMEYTVTFNHNYGTTPTETTANSNQEGKVTPPDMSRIRVATHTFDGWFTETDGGEKIDFTTEVFNADITLYAHWLFKPVVITFDLNYNGKPTPATATTSTANGRVTTADPTRTTHTFDGWFTETDGGEKINLNTKEFTATQTLYAHWLFKPVVITFDLNYNGKPTPTTATTSTANGRVTTADPTRTTHTFDGWYTLPDKGEKINLATKEFTTVQTLYAQWLFKPVVITFDLNYTGKPAKSTLNTNAQNGRITDALPVSPNDRRTTHTFDGWYTQAVGGDKIDLDTKTFTAPQTLYAHWLFKPVAITFILNYEGAMALQPINTNPQDGKATITTPTRTTHNFIGWFTLATGGEMIDLDAKQFTAPQTLHARWQFKSVVITFDLNYTGKPTPTTATTSTANGRVTVADPTRTTHNFIGWFTMATDGEFVNLDIETFTAPQTLYAHWTQGRIVEFDTQGGSSIDTQVLLAGTKRATRPEQDPQRTHYIFDNWYTEPMGGEIFNFATIIETKKIIYAHWIHKKYTVTFRVIGNQIAAAKQVYNPPQQTVLSGNLAKKPTINLITGTNIFLGWYENEIPSDGDIAFDFSTPITRDITLITRWKGRPIIITFDFNYDGSNIPQKIEYEYNADGTPPTDPYRSPHYTFEGWHKTRTPSTNTKFNFNAIPDIATKVFAHWIRKEYTVTLNHNYGTTPTITTVKSDNVKGFVTPTVPIRTGTDSNLYTFLFWYKPADINNPNDPNANEVPFDFTKPIDENVTLYAKWTTGNIIIEFDTQGGSLMPKQEISSGSNPKRPTQPPLKRHYLFTNWYTQPDGGVLYNFDAPITTNTTVYAQYSFRPETKQALKDEITKKMTADGNNADLNYINTSLITDMSELFKNSPFNGNISNWNTSNVKDMSSLFSTDAFTTSSFNGDISKWDVSNVTNMENMFRDNDAFNGNISNWNTSNVKDMSSLFRDNDAFNGNISNWNTANVTSMAFMFVSSQFNGNISNWNTANVTGMASMFFWAQFNGNISNWNTANVTNMVDMFRDSQFNGDIGNWNTSNVIHMRNMFLGASLFNQDISNWNTTLVNDMSSMFSDTNFNQDISNWNVDFVDDMSYMFEKARAFDQNIDKWNVKASVRKTQIFDNSPLANKLPSWMPKTVTFYQNYTGASPESVTVNIDITTGKATPNINRPHYRITGWYTQATEGAEIDIANHIFRTPTTNLYARWEKIQYTVTFDFNYTGSTPIVLKIDSGDEVTRKQATPIPNRSAQHYTFGNWYTKAEGGELAALPHTVTKDITFYTHWNRTKYTVSFNLNYTNPPPNSTPEPERSDNNGLITPPTSPTRSGNYKFLHWYLPTDSSNPGTSGIAFNFYTTTIDANITLFAQWTMSNMVLSFNTQGGTGIDAQEPASGSTPTKPTNVPIKQHYVFKNWYTTADGDTLFNFDEALTTSKTAYAQYIPTPETKAKLLEFVNTELAKANGNTANLNHIDTKLITDMSELFLNKADFNGNISEWNVSKVTNMDSMFKGASSFNQSINSWNTSKVTYMSNVFYDATNFNQHLSNWNTSIVTTFSNMFKNAGSFDKPINSWNTASATDMSNMFESAVAFNQPISKWNAESVTNMNKMFKGATVFNQNIDAWSIPASVTKTDAFTDSGLANSLPTWARP